VAYASDMSNEEIARCWRLLKALAELGMWFDISSDDLVKLMETLEQEVQ